MNLRDMAGDMRHSTREIASGGEDASDSADVTSLEDSQ
jgi:hypothetical protein